ncbi:hypothetical protein RclHR1_03100001 [Rhizophagus clarus]|uniref:Uncharacterized protein n=1 Tax=Rhizophagus clarus TaxID=94130 RepID=A0A2Z6RLD2_9GLOM|nr:hypothetical protein RclHR1_03100001 [Rhizophagus clarus]GES93933.1 hypothetical protein GLOIN_2v1481253 [Rhizophagus clarus]
MFNELPKWMHDFENLISGDPVKGLGTYEIFINKDMNIEINEKTLEKWEKEAKRKKDITHKLALAGFYMKCNEVNEGNYNKTNKCYKKAKDLYLEAEAKLCL